MFSPLLDDIQRLNQHLWSAGSVWQAPRLEPVALRLQARRIAGPQSVREALANCIRQPGCLGWIETPQTLSLVELGSPLPAGTPLHAELWAGDRAMSLRWGDGEWCLTEFEELQSGATDPEAVACLASHEPRVSSLSGVTTWHYRVYHRLDAHGQLRPFAARLAGADRR